VLVGEDAEVFVCISSPVAGMLDSNWYRGNNQAQEMEMSIYTRLKNT